MNFFQMQDDAHRRTGWLIGVFVITVVLIVAAVDAVMFAVMYCLGTNSPEGVEPVSLFTPEMVQALSISTAVTLGLILLGTLFKSWEISHGGGRALAEQLGGSLVPANTTDFAQRRLLNIVEEMALAAGIPMPAVYVLKNESGINAFAAGISSDDAVVAVTRGALEYLTRDELQGILGHEFSHIFNGDMRLNLRLIGLLHGILLVYIIGTLVFRIIGHVGTSRDDDNNKGALAILFIGLSLMLIGWVGHFFGQIIRACVSRQREYLADASSVQFTRNPEGLAGALKKVGGLARGSLQKVVVESADEASHLYFSRANGEVGGDWFSTHPPLEKRILALDPQFDGKYPLIKSIRSDIPQTSSEPQESEESEESEEFSKSLESSKALKEQMADRPKIQPWAQRLATFVTVLAACPEEMRTSVSEPYAARALILAILLKNGDDTLKELLSQHVSKTFFGEVKKSLSKIQTLEMSRLFALAEAAIPALRQMSAKQYQEFRSWVKMLITADGRVEMDEYILQAVVMRTLDFHFGQRIVRRKMTYVWDSDVRQAAQTVLSRLAQAASDDVNEIQKAYEHGRQLLPLNELPLLDRNACRLPQVDAALNLLDSVSPPMKQALLEAFSRCVLTDGVMNENEACFLFAICGALGVPFSAVKTEV